MESHQAAMTDINRNTKRHTKLPIRGHDSDISPRTHPFATSRLPPIGNTDPTSEFMYQMPTKQGFGKSMSEGGNLACYGPLECVYASLYRCFSCISLSDDEMRHWVLRASQRSGAK